MKAGLIGAFVGGVFGGVLAGATLVIVLIPVGVLLGAIAGVVVVTLARVGNAEEEARVGYQVVCPSTSELVTVKLDPAKARWAELAGSHQEVTRCSGHWNGPPDCGYPCVKQVDAERTEGETPSRRKHWSLLSGMGNARIEGMGGSREEAFAEAAMAITGCVKAPNLIQPTETIELTCEADSDTQLLHKWLETVIRESREQGLLMKRFKVELDGNVLKATARGEKTDPESLAGSMPTLPDHDPQLEVHQNPTGGWVVRSGIILPSAHLTSAA